MPRSAGRIWEQLADPQTGRLLSSMPADRLIAYERVELRDHFLCFSGRGPFRSKKPPADLLERFLNARTVPALLRVAKQYGPLVPPRSRIGEDDEHREPVKMWEQFRWQFEYLLSIAAGLRGGLDFPEDIYDQFKHRGIQVERRVFLLDIRRKGAPHWRDRTSHQRRVMALDLLLRRTSFLVRSCDVRPALGVTDFQKPSFELIFQSGGLASGISLLGSLLVQFLASATGSGFAVCSSCGGVFVPKRRQPAFGRRRYCAGCGRPAALRDAKAAFRARQRDKQIIGKKRGKR